MKYVLPKGFLANGTHCGIKRFKKDLALIYSKTDAKAVAVFTKNKVKAAPVMVSKAILKKAEPIKAVIVNSGNANCCTGWYGTRDAKRMISAVSKEANLKFASVLVASTGIIGQRLPIELIEAGVPVLVKRLSEKGLMAAAKAVLTTDKRPKIAIERLNIGRKEITLTAFCKGAGMINPYMATMLCFIMTDAKIDKDALKISLKESCDRTFNSITVDGDMSTNDSVFLLANGSAGNATIKRKTKEYKIFKAALETACFRLAKNIIEDGEGATKFITVLVENAKTKRDAYKAARMIANSCLVKTSVHGENPNWGRVASAVGASGVRGINPNKFDIYLDGVCVFKNGKFTMPSKIKFSRIYKRKNVEIAVNLNLGKKDAKIWTCDLSKRYIEINSHYRT